ncbi:MAG TPA: hypothetical protein VFQ68_26350 [Streptosporangiaceae bacterium]|nr:hypothetical protein [Streptosporangiaceae bacterium]
MSDNMILMARMRGDEMTRQARRSRLAARIRATARHEAARARTARRPVRWLVGGMVSRAR